MQNNRADWYFCSRDKTRDRSDEMTDKQELLPTQQTQTEIP